MNALNRQVQEEIREAARQATVRADVKSVIVYGGEKVFAAGADIKELAELSFVRMETPPEEPEIGEVGTPVISIDTVAREENGVSYLAPGTVTFHW